VISDQALLQSIVLSERGYGKAVRLTTVKLATYNIAIFRVTVWFDRARVMARRRTAGGTRIHRDFS
jgi:hypothetical protein